MPKFLVEANYSAAGLVGLKKSGAAARREAAEKAAASLGGSVEAFYFSFGSTDAIVLADMPDNASAAALAVAVSSSGLVHTRTTPLLTVEEMGAAVKKSVKYKPPGK